MQDLETLKQRIDELEMKLSFQDDLLTSLNTVIANQDREIQDLWVANKILKQSIKDGQAQHGGSQNEPPPPHY